jgi:hypothetical protein
MGSDSLTGLGLDFVVNLLRPNFREKLNNQVN